MFIGSSRRSMSLCYFIRCAFVLYPGVFYRYLLFYHFCSQSFMLYPPNFNSLCILVLISLSNFCRFRCHFHRFFSLPCSLEFIFSRVFAPPRFFRGRWGALSSVLSQFVIHAWSDFDRLVHALEWLTTMVPSETLNFWLDIWFGVSTFCYGHVFGLTPGFG